jgi:glucose-1-phosphate adenylyltransferase
VTFGGIYRIIDITLSNCVNSGLRASISSRNTRRSRSIVRSAKAGIFRPEIGEFIEILPPMKRVSENWYMGTADAVYQNIYSIGSEQPKYVIILSGDHIYKMNYERMLKQHQDAAADVTVATLTTDPAECRHFGVVDIDHEHRITGFLENPSRPISDRPTIPRKFQPRWASISSIPMCSFRCSSKTPRIPIPVTISARIFCPKCWRLPRLRFQLCRRKQERSALLARRGHARSLLRSQHGPGFGLSRLQSLRRAWPIRTHQRQYPPAKFVFAESGRMGHALDSLVSSGCIISGGSVQNCVLSPDVRVNSYSEIENSILFSHVNVGRSCRIRKAIIDRDVHIPEGTTTIGYDAEADRERYFVTDSGITVVTRDYSLFENPVTVDYFTSE